MAKKLSIGSYVKLNGDAAVEEDAPRKNRKQGSETGGKNSAGDGYGKVYDEDDDYDDDEENDEDIRAGKIRERVKREYHDKDKTKIRAEIPYKNGRIDGMLKTYHKNGKAESETVYKNGKENGMQREYYKDGALKSERVYKNGKGNGPKKKYNEEGMLTSEIYWKGGLNGFYLLCSYGPITYRYQYAGTGTVYHCIDLITHYKNGRLDGMEEDYVRGKLSQRSIYKKGVRLRLTSYESGMKHGKEIWWDESGRPIRVVVYDKGEITGIKGKAASKLGSEYDYNSYPNGKYKSALSFKDGVYLAHYRYYAGSFSAGTGGEPALEIPLKHGLAEGLSKEYYQKHKRVRTAAYYTAGVKNGIEKNFYPNGTLSSELSFKDGEKDGTEKRYSKRMLSLSVLKALIRGGPGQPAEELYFRGGIKIGSAEAALYLYEPFEDDD
jgi:antitoxin component YwqK of YwqJK toxin-antitoxin module